MTVSYKKLWKLLIDKDLKKTDLHAMSGISWGSINKLTNNETINLSILMRICEVLNCEITEILEFIPNSNASGQTTK